MAVLLLKPARALIVFLDTKNPQTILKYRRQIQQKRFFYQIFFQREEVSWLQCLSEVQLPKLFCVLHGSQVCCLPKARCSAFHALMAHCDCSIPAVSQPSRKGPGKAGISYHFDSGLVASILLARLNLWRTILAEMTFQRSSNHRI